VTGSLVDTPDDEQKKEDALFDVLTEQPGHWRDMMRLAVKQILGKLCSFDHEYKYHFIAEFNRAVVQAELGLRPSFQFVLQDSELRLFRVKLELEMLARKVFREDGEVIVEHGFVDHQQVGRVKLLVLTNYAYYLSTRTYDQHYDPQETDMSQFTSLERFEYDRIVRIHRGLGGQLFAIESAASATSKLHDVSIDVFINRTLGVSEKLMQVFSRKCLDDLSQPLTIENPAFERKAFAVTFIDAGAGNDRSLRLPRPDQEDKWTDWQRVKLRLFTHGYVLQGRKQVHRVLALVINDSRAQLVSCTVNVEKFTTAPHVGIKHLRSYLALDEIHELDRLEAVEWTDTSKALMVLAFPGRTCSVFFPCDTQRMRWKRALHEFMSTKSGWRAKPLPDLHSKDKHTRKLL